MIRSSRFWISMIVFQVVFGLTVFAATRYYYVRDAETVIAKPATVATPEWPRGSEQSELENLISTFPGPGVTTDPAALSRQADEAFSAGQYGKAADLYQKLLSADPDNADTYNNLGITLHYLGLSDEALQLLNRGVIIDPSYQRIWLTLGYVNSQVGNINEAREALSHAAEIDPNSVVGQSATKMLEELGP